MRDLYIKTMLRLGLKESQSSLLSAEYFGEMFDRIERGNISGIDSVYLTYYSVMSYVTAVQAEQKRNEKHKYMRRIALSAIQARLSGLKTYIVCSSPAETQYIRDLFFSIIGKLVEKGVIHLNPTGDVLDRGSIHFLLYTNDDLLLDQWKVRGVSEDKASLLATPKALECAYKKAFEMHDYFNQAWNLPPFILNAENALDSSYISKDMAEQTVNLDPVWTGPASPAMLCGIRKKGEIKPVAIRANYLSYDFEHPALEYACANANHKTKEDEMREDLAFSLGMLPKP